MIEWMFYVLVNITSNHLSVYIATSPATSENTENYTFTADLRKVAIGSCLW